MVFVKHNSLKSDISFNPIFIPSFSGSRFFRVQVFQGPGSGSRVRVHVQGPRSGSKVRVQGPGSRSRVRVQVLEVDSVYDSISGRTLMSFKDILLQLVYSYTIIMSICLHIDDTYTFIIFAVSCTPLVSTGKPFSQ